MEIETELYFNALYFQPELKKKAALKTRRFENALVWTATEDLNFNSEPLKKKYFGAASIKRSSRNG